ncbi:monooxygenase 2-like isoform X2 [Diospyros lotus]|uniref:monooxygenase 2-like isoform X2 n=1 Tax=Diospyros lotus TaxID=55363 RepID=UPI00224CE8EA|nr:monooxygenase 2-like isoform X2 [Diospyros lotus]
MEAVVQDVVIVGAGIAGLTTSLGLHRLGVRSLVLESSESLRTTGFALAIWTNAWRALDAVGVSDSLRQLHTKTKGANHEVRCVKRKLLLEALARELPSGTIRYSSKVVCIEETGYLKLVHLADGTVIKSKVLIGSEGVNSVVANWLDFKKPPFDGRAVIRGCAEFKSSHGFEPKLMQFFGNGIRCGCIPCDDYSVYFFFTFVRSSQDKEVEENPAKMKEFILSKLGKSDDHMRVTVEKTELDSIMCSPLRFRPPWQLLWGNISKGNVCVAGDALHPMTPDIGQGGCAALEDGIVLARCLAEALLQKPAVASKEKPEKEEFRRIEMGLKKYAQQRRWRSFELIATASLFGCIQQSNGPVMRFLREKVLAVFLSWLLLKRASFDCGQLSKS